MIAAAMLMLAATPIVKARGPNSAQLSPDLEYVALTVHGEADCQYLFIVKIAPKGVDKGTLPRLFKEAGQHATDSGRHRSPKGTVIERMDAETFLWLPDKPHSLVYGESGIYGDQVVAMWSERKPRVLASPKEDEAEVFVSSYDPSKRRLSYTVRYAPKYPKFKSVIRHLVLPRR
jgi:hypothetical protein